MVTELDQKWMKAALVQARKGEQAGEVPVGAVVVKENKMIGFGFNQVIGACDPTAHAEIVALRQAAKSLGNYRLNDCIMYLTLEPCIMCLGAMVHARVKRVFFAAYEPKAGVVDSNLCLHQSAFLNHKIDFQGGMLQDESSRMLQAFFRRKRLEKQTRK